MLRTILIAVTVDDLDDALVTDEALEDGIRARLDEFYPTDGYPFVPTDVRVAVTNPDAAHHLAAAADVGLGYDIDADDAPACHAAEALDTLTAEATR